jgi:hypothetical protein
MKGKIAVFLILLLSGFWITLAEAKIARGGGGMRSGVSNRSAGVSRSNVNRGNIDRSNIDRSNVNRQSRDVNRNVDRNVNRDVDRDIDRDVDIHGGWGGGWYHDDNDWGWGSFAAGAAIGAVGAAVVDDDDTVVIMPSTGGYVAALPSNCEVTTGGGGPTLYECDGVYYQPTYQGATLMYQVVQP